MEIVNETELYSFAKKHSNARRSIANWIDVTRAASWKSFDDIRKTFRSADYVKGLVVFDLGGNNHRLISTLDFTTQRVYVLELMTHAEYDRWKA